MKLFVFKKFVILAIILGGGAIASCQDRANNRQASTSNQNCRAIEHELGETEVCGQPQRIVVLGPYVLEPLLALGMQPVAFGDHAVLNQGDYDNPAEQIPYIGSLVTQPVANVGLAYEPSIEAITKVQPDLILGLKANGNHYETLSQIAPTILLDWSELETNLRKIALAVNRNQQAEQQLKDTEQKIAAARETFAPVVASNPKMLLLYSEQLKQIALSGPAPQLCNSLPEKLGFQLLSSPEANNAKPHRQIPISIETLPQFNEADSVIMLGRNLSDPGDTNNFNQHQLSKVKQAWQKNAIAQSLDASKAGRVYFIPAYLCLALPGTIGTELYLEELEQQLLPPQ